MKIGIWEPKLEDGFNGEPILVSSGPNCGTLLYVYLREWCAKRLEQTHHIVYLHLFVYLIDAKQLQTNSMYYTNLYKTHWDFIIYNCTTLH